MKDDASGLGKSSKTKNLDSHVQYVKGVGPGLSKTLQKVEIQTIEDLLFYFPKRYEDRSRFTQVAHLEHGRYACVCGRVVMSENQRTRRGMVLTRVGLDDGTGVVTLVFFNQAYLKERFVKLRDQLVIAYGEVRRLGWNVELQTPEWEEVVEEGDSLQIGRITPVYPLTDGLYQKTIRRAIRNALDTYLDQVDETLPKSLLERLKLPGIQDAIRGTHYPENADVLKASRYRLIFEDFFLLQMALALRKNQTNAETSGVQFDVKPEYLESLRKIIPFQWTNAQERVIREITADMGRSKTMHRLLQGDVGSGKTLVAMAAICVAVHNGYQAVLMAPTEILAEQHYLVLSEKFKELGIEVELMIGGLTKKEKEAARERLSSGTAQIAIGTHALIQENVDFSNLGLVVIDEQHRFGVVQRAALRQKGLSPDVLVMTATPIPRTLALTLYGDLDVSVIDELPPGRKPIKTHWKYTTDRNKVYAAVKKLIAEGRQAYVVCPLVEESEKLEVQAATKLAEQLQTQVFPDLRVGLLHGQMRPREKEAVMAAFRRGEIDILASTTVIEVGVDVPNASVMVIEDAVRFGLAQLHQLRGRVGRGEYQSYCILLADPKTDDGIRRMEVMTRTNDGFVIAEEDLQIRGPGEFYGTRQHGLPSLRIADIIKDITVLEIAREEAFKLLSEDPHLQKFENRVLRDALTRKMVDFELAAIG